MKIPKSYLLKILRISLSFLAVMLVLNDYYLTSASIFFLSFISDIWEGIISFKSNESLSTNNKSKFFIVNSISTLRILLSVPIIILSYTHKYSIVAIVYSIGFLTDEIDGLIARKWNISTDFGKWYDPFCSSILVHLTMFSFCIWFPLSSAITWVIWISLGVISRTSEDISQILFKKEKTFFKSIGLLAGSIFLDFGVALFLLYYYSKFLVLIFFILTEAFIIIAWKKYNKSILYHQILKKLRIRV